MVDDGDRGFSDRAAAAIEVHDLTRLFSGTTAVDRLSLRVERGEIFGFLGPNGAGKTTTLRMLSTLLRPTAGEAWVAGFDVTREPMEVRRRLGVMTERPALYERLTVDANLRLWAEAHEVPDADGAIRTALEAVDLGDRRHHSVSSLSKGLRQRASLARAILHRPAVLLLDEPSSGLDPAAAVQVEAMIRELVRDGTTVFLNTHRLAEAQRLCDRVAILKTGLVALGTPAELRARIFGNAISVQLADPLTVAVTEAVRRVPGVEHLAAQRTSFECRLKDIEEGTPCVVAAVVAAGGRVLEVKAAGDLEQAYLDLVSGDSSQPGVQEPGLREAA